MFDGFRRWRRQRRLRREARRLLDEAFSARELLRGTSLRPQHHVRSQLVDFEEDGGRIVKIHFGILRHPRPYAFSRQSHHVIEYYVYDVAARRIEVVRGVNITRREGRDAD